MVPDNLNTLNYPIETPEAKKFWASKHKCNKMKSIIAFSLNLSNANANLRRYGYTLSWRKKALRAFGEYVNKPKMTDIPFSEITTPWWECMPYQGSGTIVDKVLKIWIDADLWEDDMPWEEFLETLPEETLKEWIDADPWGDAQAWEEYISSK